MSNISIHRVIGDDTIIVSTKTHHIALDARAINDRGQPNWADRLEDDDFELVGKLYPIEVGDVIHSSDNIPKGTIVKSGSDSILKMIGNGWHDIETGDAWPEAYPATIVRLGFK